MTIKEIAALAEQMLGLKEPASETEAAERKKDLLAAVNLTVNELAAEYLPLVKTEAQEARGGKIYYTALSERPIAILSVRRAGEEKRAAYRVMPAYLALANGAYEVEYRYYPAEKGESDACDYGETRLPKRVIAYGAAAEYCLMRGLYEECSLWDKRFKDSLAGYCRPKRLRIRRPYFT